MKAQLIDKFLVGTDETEPIKLIGYCDIIIQGMSSGTVTLQYKLVSSGTNAETYVRLSYFANNVA